MLYVFLLILISFAGCKQDVTVPQHLIGVWTTSAPKYADRYLKFTEYSLIIGIGNGEEVSHSIQKIEVKKENNETVYTFHYKDSEGEKWTLILTYRPDSGGTIRLKNRNEIWKKVKPEGTG